ncbi:CoA-binding domain protein [Catenulispora acidiphila DSM 44928]|uniref:CoA-binding domain protein n=1 Tax=Catenulispora acidiphila (strain DSM 44928 / JCM 14897 / NBRC 102108 / NRRL B-24433 / ID139908) TaxID=479433 RepID=C7Q9U9_CATAD|nr:acetate--CoA ligase [Catenulispora acidiphila]ACU76268.1 CoA-binding domain protein [Catenulispora acidiphila DSM 44928]
MSRDLAPLFDPVSVAVVGASDDPAKYGHAIASQALRAPHRRPIHLVNRRGGTVLGQAAATSLTAIGEPVGLVVVSVPAAVYEETVEEALACGASAIVAVTAGFAETGADGLARQRAVAERVRAAGAVLVGPNCLGIADNTTELYLASDAFDLGGVALLSQSGNLALELQLSFAPHGLGFSRFVSLGNQSDVTLVDLVEDCARHEATQAIAVYAEDFGDGRAFAAAAAAAGKAVVLLSAGRGSAAARSAASHTGALTTSSDIVAAACRDAGVELVRTPREMTAVLAAVVGSRRARGRRVAVFTDGGGHGVVAADAAEAAGFDVPELGAQVQNRLAAHLWGPSALGNPVDLAGMGEQDPMSYANVVRTLLDADEVDAVLMTGYFGGYSADSGGLGGAQGSLGAAELAAADSIARAVRASPKPVVAQSMYPDAPSCQTMQAAGIPVFAAIEDAARALQAVVVMVGDVAGGAAAIDPLPEPAAPMTDTGYYATRALLAEAGVRFPASAEICDEDALRSFARGTSGPFVLKALHLLHKSDAGGVALNLADEEALVAAYRETHARLTASSYSVEEMADLGGGVELIVGVNRDPRFGPIAMVGLGGVFTEVLGDVAFALAPVSAARAEAMLRGLRCAALLDGVRGRPAVDVAAAAKAIEQITGVAAAHHDIAEFEVNPLLALPSGTLALDARAVPLVPLSPSEQALSEQALPEH